MSNATKDAAAEGRIHEFLDLVNMSATQLEKWLDSEESQAVGQHKDDSAEATGHVSGREIAKILRSKRRAEFSDAEMTQITRTVSYIKRHLAQRPHAKDLEHTRWAASLKNWGHDPC